MKIIEIIIIFLFLHLNHHRIISLALSKIFLRKAKSSCNIKIKITLQVVLQKHPLKRITTNQNHHLKLTVLKYNNCAFKQWLRCAKQSLSQESFVSCQDEDMKLIYIYMSVHTSIAGSFTSRIFTRKII